MSCTRTIYQAIEEAILEYTDGTGSICSDQEEGLWNIADRTAAALAQAPTIIRTVEELEALDPYDVIAYKSPEGYGLVCTAYDATIGDTDYTLPVATACSNNTTMPALQALNQEES